MQRSHLSARVCGSWLLSVLLFAAVLFGGVTSAYAGTVTTWSGLQPVGAGQAVKPVIATGRANSDGKPLVASSVKLYVDGVLISRPTYTASVLATYVYVYYTPSPVLTDGAHTFRVEVTDAAGKLSFKQWSSTIAQPPSATWLSPASGSTVCNGRPTIVMSLADNTPATTFSVVGQVRSGSSNGPVVATFGGAGLTGGPKSFAPSSELVFGAQYLTATVTDAAGNAQQLTGATSRSFTAISAPAMTVLESCDGCHAATRTAHLTPTATDCGVCHPDKVDDHMEGTDYCEDCHTDGWHNPGGASVKVTGSCTSCHTSSRPEVVRHTAASTSVTHEGSCGGCHFGSLISTHAATPVGSSYAYQCDMCHGSTDSAVQAAIMTEDTSCSACHLDGFHEGFAEKHTNASMDPSCVGSGCHAAMLEDAHSAYVGPGNRYPQYADTCALCHSNADPERIPQGTTAECESCHESADHESLHTVARTDQCASCHEGASLTTVHMTRGTVTCATCHESIDAAIVSAIDSHQRECGACHDSAQPHGNDYQTHAATSAASLSCATVGCHETANTVALHSGRAEGSCAVCHDNPTSGDRTAGKTSKDCEGCHTTSGVDYHRNMEVHVTPASYYELCGTCHHGWGSNPIKGPDVTGHTGGCTTCHNATTDLTGKTTDCDSCHTTPGAGAKPANYHQDFATDHTATSTASTACVRCHDTADVRTLHDAAPDKCATCHTDFTCGECHDLHQGGEAGLTAGVECVRCHSTAGTDYHEQFTPKHTYTAMDASCQADGCHSNALVTAHQAYVGTGKRYPQYVDTCALCHINSNPSRIPANATSACSSCHSTMHSDLAASHTGDGSDSIGATHGDSVYMSCSGCHTTSILPLHANYCAACHSSSAPAAVKAAVANHNADCTACHAGPHYDVSAHDSFDYSGCGPCHGDGCTQCHPASTPVPKPTTTSDVKAAYVNTATIKLTPDDAVNGSFGINATYYNLDGAGDTIGTQIVVPAPASGTESHTLKFWSTDYSGHTETPTEVTFTVSHDSFPPVTTSNIVSGKTYVGNKTFTLTPSDADSSVSLTRWQLDSTSGPWTAGTSVPVAAPATDTVSHTLYYYSVDNWTNTETVKSVSFSMAPGQEFSYTGATQSLVIPSGVTAIDVTVNGASGADNQFVQYYGASYGLGGAGGRASAMIPVTSGSSLTVYVGGKGRSDTYNSPGGWPNGGRANSSYAGGGGGSSSIWLGLTELIEAGGGGGGGYYYAASAGGNGGSQGTLPGGFRTGTASTYANAGGGGGGWNAGLGGTANYRGGSGGTSYIASGSGTLTSGTNLGSGSVTVRYSFAPVYVVTYAAGANGTLSGTTPQTVLSGGSGSAVTAVANTGYHFVNWSDGSTANPRTDTNVPANKSVTANFEINTYTLTYTAGGNGTVSGTVSQSVDHGGSGSAVTAVANTGYHFVNWSDGSTANPRTDTNVTANKSVTANFASNAGYTLTYTAGANGSISGVSPQTGVPYGGSGLAVTAVPNTGYRFVNWSDGSTANPRTDTNVTADKSETASFAVQQYTINSSHYTGGTISPFGPSTVTSGGSKSYTGTPNAGNRLAWWLVDGAYQLPVEPYTFSNVTANHSIYAGWGASTTRTLLYPNTPRGSTSGQYQLVASGGSGAWVTAFPYLGYHFVDWSDGSTANPRRDINVTTDQLFTPNFAPNSYTFTYAAGANGQVTGTLSQTGLFGSTATAVTAVPSSGYRFLGWSDGVPTATRTDTIGGDATLTALFAANGTKTVKFYEDGNGYIGGQWIQGITPGGSATAVTANPHDSANYTFSYWSNGTDFVYDNPMTVTNVSSDATWTAYFSYTGSCPFLYTWDGNDYKFEADEFAAGKLALQTSKGYRKPNPLDYHMLATTPASKDGALEYKLVEERDETDYLDQTKLYTVDAQADRDAWIERSQAEGVGQFTTLNAVIHTTEKNLQPPPSVIWLNTGEDVTSKVASSDGDYVVLNKDRNVGFNYQTLELDLGDVQSAPQTKLVIDGRTMIPSSPAGRTYSRQFGAQVKFEVQDTNGNWVAVPTTNTILPKPPEFKRPFILNLSRIWVSDSRKVRLTYLYKTYFDSILLDTSADTPVTITELPLQTADLQPHGFNFRSGTGELFDYVYGTPFSVPRYELPGNYTRFGDVSPLLGSVDDKFVIFGGGDELTLRFTPPSMTPDNISRRYLFLSNGYYKDLKENIAHTVEPLPFAAMSNFPYPETESYPNDSEHQEYLTEWNTRYEGE